MTYLSGVSPPEEPDDAASEGSRIGDVGEGGGPAEKDDSSAVDAEAPPPCPTRFCNGVATACIPCRAVVQRWPRTCAIFLGVVCPLFLLIFVAAICGYGLAELEGPVEIQTNNAIIATRMALAFHAAVVGNVTRKLPVICACTFMLDEEREERDVAFQECLRKEQEERNRTELLQLNGTSGNRTEVQLNGTSSGNASSIPVLNGTSDNTSTPTTDDVFNTILNISDGVTDAVNNCTKPPALDVLAIEATVQEIVYEHIEGCGEAPINTTFSRICGKEVFQGANTTISPNLLLKSMNECGVAALDVVESYRLGEIVVAELASQDITFDWIRCTDGKVNLADVVFNPLANTSMFRPEAQEELVVEAWLANQREMYCAYVDMAVAANKSLAEAEREAMRQSFSQASGFDSCEVNSYAGGWFWFTVMTTIGYGNTAPVTDGGRAMIYTLGFASILIFAGLLAKAGSIVVAVIDDWLHRLHLSVLAWPSIQAFVWGGLYYLWSFLIASYYVHWNDDRLAEEITYKDAYWFAYMSTTTIGLGDYYLDHSVIIGIDLLVWPLLILFGFVLLSAFLNKVGELVASFLPKEQADFAGKLAAEEHMFSCCPTRLRRHKPGVVQEADEVEGEESMPAKECGQSTPENEAEEDIHVDVPFDEK
ncbi:hypothetical protein ACHAXT_010531 [Thalassiosira profunda]